MKEMLVTIVNDTGLHARPAAQFVQRAQRFKADISVKKEEMCVNGKSMIGILTLGANKGSQIKIIANGEDEVEAAKQLAEFVNSGLEE
ncbi:phosphocarrier protein [Clostridium amylolyticum]|uniref:Phosphocarrier protein HPr n=1 Tax=Clostridium amylolyticum TaxID=1121298 RepID=A0A1M6MZQ3_9CLOT|nr:HPr family phosphocarrier protein [Clostridium amylolyticum]SHJ88894.1 phosphocarrier protein [Clostridium amylolyticum]